MSHDYGLNVLCYAGLNLT